VIIDISEQVLAHFDNAGRNRSWYSTKKQMISWLEENVGEYYGEIAQDYWRAYTGAGWEWGTRDETVYEHAYAVGQVHVTWFVKLNDEAAATMFRLKFL